MNPALAVPMEQYHQAKPDGDIDLIDTVRQSLLMSGLGHQVTVAYNQNRFILEAEGKSSDVQRFLLNRYWNMQLAMAAKPSIEERYCLIPDGTIQDWLTLFKEKVLPFLITHQLPIVI